MNFPVTLDFGFARVTLHALCEVLAYSVAFQYYRVLRHRRGDHIDDMSRLWVIVGAALGALIGSRVLGACEDLPAFYGSAHPWWYVYGNKTVVGGILGGWIGVELTKKFLGEKQRTGDLFVMPLMLGMIIGRVGCFSAGVYEETYGVATSLPWGMNLGDGVMRHPVALYEIIFLVLLWIALAQWVRRVQLRQGVLFKILVIAYLLFRFAIDFIKPGWRFAFGLGSIQLACGIGILLAGYGLSVAGLRVTGYGFVRFGEGADSNDEVVQVARFPRGDTPG